MSRAEKQFDQQLLDLAHTLLAVHAVETSVYGKAKTQSITPIPQRGSFAFQVLVDNKLVLKTNNAPDHLIVATANWNDNAHEAANKQLRHPPKENFLEVNFLDKRWRALALSTKTSPEHASLVSVIVAQPLQAQFVLAQELILAAMTPMIVAIVILPLLIYAIITRGLKPLHQLRSELGKRKANDFSSLNLQAHNSELSDIVITLNQLFSRLDGAFKRERHFAEDAAHELKTPLSVLKINVHNLTQDFSKRLSIGHMSVTAADVSRLDSIKELTSSVNRMGHIIDQILNLNRTNSAQIIHGSARFNLNVILQQVIAELYNGILNKEQSIELESSDVDLCAHEFSVHLLAVNLISNAIKYTPIGGKIKISVKQNTDDIILSVEDSGSGINPQEYERIFDRFYRVGGDQHNSDALGCGLGLTIVKHIADIHGAKIALSSSSKLQGLQVDVHFKHTIVELAGT